MSWLGFCLLISIFLGHGVDTQAPEGITENKAPQCQKPAIDKNMETLQKDKDQYEVNEQITVRCKSGYYPYNYTMTCTDPGTASEWSPSDTCTEVTVTEERVTSTTISLRISCLPDCPQSWGFAANISLANQPATPCHASSGERRVTCSGLQPASPYTVYIYINQTLYPVVENIQTREPEVTMTDVGVSSTNISFRISCLPECLQSWGFAVRIYLANQQVTRCHVSGAERRVRCSGLRPASNYTVRGYFYINQKWYPVIESIIQTEPARCKKPEAAGLSTTPEYGESYIMEDSIEVRCDPGYRPAHNSIKCVQAGDGAKWHPQPQCIAQCKRPQIANAERPSKDKDYYEEKETLTVSCHSGYYPSSISTSCERRRTDHEWAPNVTCREKCRKPGSDKPYTFTGVGDFYDTGAQVTVRCNSEAHRAQPERIQCQKGTERDEWSHTPQCIEKCKGPEINKQYTFTEKGSFYNLGARVTVQCNEEGFRPEPETIQCVQKNGKDDWSASPRCVDKCKGPGADKEYTFTGNRAFYEPREEVTVSCNSKAYRAEPEKIQCVQKPEKDEWSASPQCIARCPRPEVKNSDLHFSYNPYYSKGEKLSIKCKAGYYPSPATLGCVNRGTPSDEWDASVTCIGMCQKPTMDNMASLSPDMDYYYKWKVITVWCNPGYYPPSITMTCDRPRTGNEWKSDVTCTRVTMSVDEVSSSSVSLLFSCHPECPQSWRFHVRYSPARQTGYTRCDSSAGRRVRCSGLQPASNYNIQGGITINWQWYTVPTTTIRTEESAPDVPTITKRPNMTDPVMKWNISTSKGVITGYQMNLSAWRDYDPSFSEADSRWFPANVTEYKIPLQYGTNYTITLRGFTAAGAGEITSEKIETEIGDPPPHTEKTLNDQTLQLHPLHNLHGPISSYEVIIFSDLGGNLTSDCLTFINLVYNSSLSPSHYTAAVITAQNLTASRPIPLGDNQYYNGFHNAPLISGHNYTVYIRVTSSWRELNKSSCSFAGFIKVLESVSSAQIIAGSVSAVILLLLLLVLVVIWRTRYYRKANHSSAIPLKPRSGLGKKKDIPVDGLLDVVKSFRKKEVVDTSEDEAENSDILPTGRYLEYKEFPSGLMRSCTVAHKDENRAKNRYKKVLPYDDCRVVLRASPSGSDYINASYIHGFKAPKFYIATQGPLQETVADFWSMVWQENSSVIVMLTGLEEKNKVKCDRYWPELSQTYGDITVSVQKIAQNGAITVRSFSLKKAQSMVQMTVEQLHYLRWPDHGVPRNSSDMMQLLELMNKCNTPGSGAIIVHCSAGIGRTGTLMALDILLKRAQATRKVNVFDCVLQLRKARVNMVQEKEQYVFLYNVLLESLLFGTTTISVSEIQKHAREMSVRDPRTGMSGYDQQFQALEKITEVYQISPCREGKKPENQEKNHNPDILPGDDCRPVLMSKLTRQGAPGYINAVFVNANIQDDILIATQLPLKQTLEDFWTLVWDYKCTAMVMMQPAKDLPVTCPRFWPNRGEVSYGLFIVKMITTKKGDGYKCCVLSLRKSDEPGVSSLEVNLWQLDSWPLDRDLPENPVAVISVIGEAERCQQQMPGSHILVTCCDGAARSGLLCAGLVVCDQIRSDGCVDVSQAARSIRKRRCQFIPSVDQYSFCHTLAQSYLDSFETYSNFR